MTNVQYSPGTSRNCGFTQTNGKKEFNDPTSKTKARLWMIMKGLSRPEDRAEGGSSDGGSGGVMKEFDQGTGKLQLAGCLESHWISSWVPPAHIGVPVGSLHVWSLQGRCLDFQLGGGCWESHSNGLLFQKTGEVGITSHSRHTLNHLFTAWISSNGPMNHHSFAIPGAPQTMFFLRVWHT